MENSTVPITLVAEVSAQKKAPAPRLSPEEKLAKELVKHAAVATLMAKIKKEIASRDAKARATKVAELGEVVMEVLGNLKGRISGERLKAILERAKSQGLS